ncbi:MAG: hypothetical protein ACOCRZ_03010 [Halothermotrichaceae bacterium]
MSCNSLRGKAWFNEIDRMGNQLEAAKHKTEGALNLTGKSLGFASEGTFGSHPRRKHGY